MSSLLGVSSLRRTSTDHRFDCVLRRVCRRPHAFEKARSLDASLVSYEDDQNIEFPLGEIDRESASRYHSLCWVDPDVGASQQAAISVPIEQRFDARHCLAEREGSNEVVCDAQFERANSCGRVGLVCDRKHRARNGRAIPSEKCARVRAASKIDDETQRRDLRHLMVYVACDV